MKNEINTIATNSDLNRGIVSLDISMDWVHDRLVNAAFSSIHHDGTFNAEELAKLANGQFIDRNGKRYATCRDCRKVIRIDKPMLGSLHLCN